jgi:hypothetical protein
MTSGYIIILKNSGVNIFLKSRIPFKNKFSPVFLDVNREFFVNELPIAQKENYEKMKCSQKNILGNQT